MNQAVKDINEAISSNDEEALISGLCNRAARLSDVSKENASWYMKMLEEKGKIKQQVVHCVYLIIIVLYIKQHAIQLHVRVFLLSIIQICSIIYFPNNYVGL